MAIRIKHSFEVVEYVKRVVKTIIADVITRSIF